MSKLLISALSSAVLMCAADARAQTTNYCLAFDGVDDFVVVARTVALEPAEVTVEMWARLDGPQDWNSRLLRKGLDDAYFITADQDLDEHMQLLITRGHSILLSAEDTQSHTAYVGAWHHFAGVYAVDRASFFRDGVRVSNVTHDLGALTHLPLTDLYIGAGLPVLMPNEYFTGRIDEVRVWDYARSDAQIQANWSQEVAGTEPGLVANWKFDEGSGQVAQDSTAYGHHGQLGATSSPEPDDPTWMVSDVVFGTPGCAWVNYCDGSVNSSGNVAAIHCSGSVAISQSDMLLEVTGAPPGRPGLFIYGQDSFHAALGNGTLCISPYAPGLFRLQPGVVIAAAGTAQHPVDFNALPPLGQITPGSTWRFQFWFRDTPAGGGMTNLSDGVAVTFCP